MKSKPAKKAKIPMRKEVGTGMKPSPSPKDNLKKKGKLKKMKDCP